MAAIRDHVISLCDSVHRVVPGDFQLPLLLRPHGRRGCMCPLAVALFIVAGSKIAGCAGRRGLLHNGCVNAGRGSSRAVPRSCGTAAGLRPLSLRSGHRARRGRAASGAAPAPHAPAGRPVGLRRGRTRRRPRPPPGCALGTTTAVGSRSRARAPGAGGCRAGDSFARGARRLQRPAARRARNRRARARPRRRGRGSGRPGTGRSGAGRSGCPCGDETPKRACNRILASRRSAAKQL